jgi:hypothetical protein
MSRYCTIIEEGAKVRGSRRSKRWYLLHISIQHSLANKWPAKNKSEAWEEAISKSIPNPHQTQSIRGRMRKRGTYNKAASPTRLNCLPQSPGAGFVVVG